MEVWRKVDNIDKVIWASPFLGILDVASTVYVESLGFSLVQYEAGFLARFFVAAGLTYIYIPVYLLILSVFAYAFWYIKNRILDSSRAFDKLIFLFVVGTACYICVRITVTFIGNFLLLYRISGRVSWPMTSLFICLSTTFTLALYLWRDVLLWVKVGVGEKE